MSSSAHQRINEPEFLGFMWAGVGLSIFFVVFRVATQWRAFRRLYWDDALIIFALVCFMASSITRTVLHKGLFYQYYLQSGKVAPTLENLYELLRSFRTHLASLVLSFNCLWLLKLAFLIFFRRFASMSKAQTIWWWCVTGLIVATWLSCFGVVPYRCLTSNLQYTLTKCTTPKSVQLYYTLFRYQTASDIATNLFIVSVPVIVFWGTGISAKQKLGLAGVLTLTTALIVFAILRVAVYDKVNAQFPDMPWIFFWYNLECTFAIVVASVGTFHRLYTKSDASLNYGTQQGASTPTKESSGVFHGLRGKKDAQPDPQISVIQAFHQIESEDHLQAPKTTHVSYEVEVKDDHKHADQQSSQV